MAIRFDASTDAVTSGGGLPGTTYTVAGWFYVSVNRANWSKIWDLEAANGRWQYLGLDPPADTPSIIFALNGAGHVNLRAAVVGAWFYAAIVSDGVGYTLYSGTPGGALTSSTWNVTPIAPTFLAVGGAGTFTGEWFNGRVAALKIWGAALTASQVEAERAQYQPARTANLLHNHPFIEAELTDYAGGANHLAAGSTATAVEDGPPILWSGGRPRLILPAFVAGPPPSFGTLGLASTARAGKVAATGGMSSLGAADTGRQGKVAPVASVGSTALGGYAAALKAAPVAGVSPVVVGSVFSRRQLSAQGGVGELGLTTAATPRKIAITGGTCSLSGASTGLQRKVAPASGASALTFAPSGSQRKVAASQGLTVLALTGNASGRKTGRQGGATGLVLVTTQARPVVYLPTRTHGGGMRGADGVRDRLAGALGELLPRKIPALRAAWGLDQGRLPDIGAISSGEMPEDALTDVADTWLEVINPRMLPGLRRVDITPAGDPQYHIRYACKLYVWALGRDWDQAMTRRDMIAVAVRLCLLEYPTLSTAGGDTEHLVLEETWSEEYGIVVRAPNDSGRCWCSAVLAVDVRAEETMADGRLRTPIGTSGRVLLAAGGYGPGVAFPDDLPTPDGFQLDTTTGAASAPAPTP